MAKRYYIVPLAFDDEYGWHADLPRETREVAPGVFRDVLPPHVAVIPSNPDGSPKFTWALVLVNVANHLPILARADIDALPDFPKDAKVGAMHQATKLAMRARLVARQINPDTLDNADGYREVLRGIGRKLDGAFHEDNFDIAD
jgi:hypothetical protein